MDQETKEQSASQEETRPGVALVTPSQGDVIAAPPTNATVPLAVAVRVRCRSLTYMRLAESRRASPASR